MGYLMTDIIHFYILATLIGLFQGGIQSLTGVFSQGWFPRTKKLNSLGFIICLGNLQQWWDQY